MNNVRNALLVGGQKRCWDPLLKYLASCNVQVWDVWHEEKHLRSSIPRNVDLVIVISSLVSHALQNHAKAEAGNFGVPVVYTSHHQTEYPEKLKKWGIQPVEVVEVIEQFQPEPERTEPVFPIAQHTWTPPASLAAIATQKIAPPPPQEVALPVAAPVVAVPTPVAEEPSMAKGKKLRKNQVRMNEKIDYIKTLLAADPAATPDDIIQKVIAKFPGSNPNKPGGIAKSVIAKIRFEEHGLRFGPGGRLFNKKGQRVSEQEKPRKASKKETMEDDEIDHSPKTNGHAREEDVQVSAPVTRKTRTPVQVSGDLHTITGILSQLRAKMKEQGIDDLHIPLEGSVRVARRSVETLDI